MVKYIRLLYHSFVILYSVPIVCDFTSLHLLNFFLIRMSILNCIWLVQQRLVATILCSLFGNCR